MKKMVSKSTHISLSIVLCVTYEPIFPILYFAFFVKNSKLEYDPHFWGGENVWKIGESSLFRYPVGQKFRRNRSISHG